MPSIDPEGDLMRYTKETLIKDLQSLGATKWQWPGEKPGRIRAEVRARNPRVGADSSKESCSSLDEIAEYCWLAYQKSLTSSGHLVIGRVSDLNAAGLYAKVADIVGGGTLFDQSSSGNLLQMDKWALVMNDAWILGGIHRQGLFRLASPRVLDNLWNKNGYFVVTAREILGLLHFGYKLEQIGPWQSVVSKNQVRASTADLIKYDSLLKKKQTLKQAQELEDRIGSSGRVARQVNPTLARIRR